MTDLSANPASPAAIHFNISQKAAAALAGRIDGNGLKADQVRLGRHETLVHKIAGSVAAALVPEISKTQKKGRVPLGQVLESDAAVLAHIDGLAKELLNESAVQKEILQAIASTPGRGFGLEPMALALSTTKKEFSVVETCQKCNGTSFFQCRQCSATGYTACTLCHAQGFTPCQTCFGSGRVQQHDGSAAGCTRCQGTGKIVCTACLGRRQLSCTACSGNGRTGCTNCGQSGSLTTVYQVIYKAEGRFDLDRQKIPADVLQIIDALGVRQLMLEEHAEVFQMPPEIRDGQILIPFVALLPVDKSEFTVAGKFYPAIVAGLQGRIMQIDPLLDALVKPGISALHKLSKGPMASQALIDSACKYRLVREVIGGLAHRPKKAVYQKLVRDYPDILSKKYANAAVQYAAKALLSISAGPRLKGLALGTLIGALLAAGYYMTTFRAAVFSVLAQKGMGRQVALADLAVWLLGYIAAFFTIRLIAARALKELLPENVQTRGKGLPAAGAEGLWALLTTFAAWLAVAAVAASGPDWLTQVLTKLHR